MLQSHRYALSYGAALGMKSWQVLIISTQGNVSPTRRNSGIKFLISVQDIKLSRGIITWEASEVIWLMTIGLNEYQLHPLHNDQLCLPIKSGFSLDGFIFTLDIKACLLFGSFATIYANEPPCVTTWQLKTPFPFPLHWIYQYRPLSIIANICLWTWILGITKHWLIAFRSVSFHLQTFASRKWRDFRQK